MEERAFLNEGNVYVSNTRVVIDETTYAMANVTSVRKAVVPAKRGCAILVLLLGVLIIVSAVAETAHSDWGTIAVGIVVLLIGIGWYQGLKPRYVVMLASSSGETRGLSSPDENLVDRTINAITSAITYRG